MPAAATIAIGRHGNRRIQVSLGTSSNASTNLSCELVPQELAGCENVRRMSASVRSITSSELAQCFPCLCQLRFDLHSAGIAGSHELHSPKGRRNCSRGFASALIHPPLQAIGLEQIEIK